MQGDDGCAPPRRLQRRVLIARCCAGAAVADALIAYVARRAGAARVLTFDRGAVGKFGFELI